MIVEILLASKNKYKKIMKLLQENCWETALKVARENVAYFQGKIKMHT